MIKLDKDGNIKPFKVSIIIQLMEFISAAFLLVGGFILIAGKSSASVYSKAVVWCIIGAICFPLACITENTSRTAYYTELQVRMKALETKDEPENE